MNCIECGFPEVYNDLNFESIYRCGNCGYTGIKKDFEVKIK